MTSMEFNEGQDVPNNERHDNPNITEGTTKTPQKRKFRKASRVRKGARYTGSAGFKTDVAVLRSQGMTQKTAGAVLGVDQATISRVEKLPEVQERISELRSAWKSVAHNKINEVASAAWDMTQKAIEKGDARSFDASMRGIVAMEKISSSVAETPQKVEVSGIPGDGDPRANIKELLITLFGPVGGPLKGEPGGDRKPELKDRSGDRSQ